jgi:hypothetical protein
MALLFFIHLRQNTLQLAARMIGLRQRLRPDPAVVANATMAESA